VFVVIGEALVDLVGQRGSRTFVAHPGGSPANVALGSRGWETPSRW
jgi:fructokinase